MSETKRGIGIVLTLINFSFRGSSFLQIDLCQSHSLDHNLFALAFKALEICDLWMLAATL